MEGACCLGIKTGVIVFGFGTPARAKLSRRSARGKETGTSCTERTPSRGGTYYYPEYFSFVEEASDVEFVFLQRMDQGGGKKKGI